MKGFDFVETVSGGADIKFADDNRVIEVGQAMYAQAASSLLEAVGDGYYYNGSIDVDGDGLYASIAAASVLAKTFRDDRMKLLHEEYPQYGWNANKGYPTRQHRLAVLRYGLTPHHRLTFHCAPGQLSLF